MLECDFCVGEAVAQQWFALRLASVPSREQPARRGQVCTGEGSGPDVSHAARLGNLLDIRQWAGASSSSEVITG